MKLFRTKSFKKDYRKLQMSDIQYSKYLKFLSLLLDGKVLPLEARDHTLTGNYSIFKEFHISGDLLVIYCTDNNTAIPVNQISPVLTDRIYNSIVSKTV